MKDRFKFRHWDKQINKMRYGDIHLSSSGEPFILHCETGKLLSIEDIDDVITLQCTGLKDKSGKLIYEGDIAKFYDDTLKQIVWLQNDTEACWCAKDNDGYALLGVPKYYEVIGNIYENPELLKGR